MASLPKELGDLVSKAVETFAKDYTLSFKSADGNEGSYRLAGVLGVASDKLNGTLFFSCNSDFLQRTHPTNKGDSLESEELHDWLQEITNQVLGRVKNFLYEHGVKTELNHDLPIVAEDLEPDDFGDDMTYSSYYTVADCPVAVHLNCASLDFIDFSQVSSEVVKEGKGGVF